jgi:hypothetical protein
MKNEPGKKAGKTRKKPKKAERCRKMPIKPEKALVFR